MIVTGIYPQKRLEQIASGAVPSAQVFSKADFVEYAGILTPVKYLGLEREV